MREQLQTPLWGEECIEPLITLDSAGVDVTVATPTGDPSVVDGRLNDPAQITEVDVAVVFPGGHGTEWDVNQDRRARALLRDAVEGDGKALVVCHAVGILAFTRTPTATASSTAAA